MPTPSPRSRARQAWEDYAKLAAAEDGKGEPVPAVYSADARGLAGRSPAGLYRIPRRPRPAGKYGAWLRDKPIVTEVGGTILMHAGIAPASAPEKIEELNVQVRDEIARLDRFVKRLLEKKLTMPSFTLQEILRWP